jgi:hypothetical protein
MIPPVLIYADEKLLCITQENGKTMVEPLVPNGAVEVITRTCFSVEPAFGPLAPRNRLLSIYEELRELYLAGVASGVNKSQDAVRLLLDTASISQEASTSAAHVDDTVPPRAATLSPCVVFASHDAPSLTAQKEVMLFPAPLRYAFGNMPRQGSNDVLCNLKLDAKRGVHENPPPLPSSSRPPRYRW